MIKRICTYIAVSTLFILFSPVYATSVILSTNTFSKITQLVLENKNPHHLLLAVDDDDTLTMMPCPSPSHCQYLGGPSWFDWQSKLPANDPQRIWTSFQELLNINNLLFMLSPMVLDDPSIPSTLKAADTRGASIIVVTDRGYRMTYVTESQLSRDKIFKLIEKDAIPTPTDHISFPGFYFPKEWKSTPTRRIAYVHGTLFVSGQNKGVLIKQFLQKTHYNHKITHIIFVDDSLSNVKDVAKAYQNNPHVNVICVYFTRLSAHKAAFLTGKNAKKLQAIANQQWYAINDSLKKSLPGFALT